MSENNLVVVITGAGRGIGNALARAYLARPDCTVVACARDVTSQGIFDLQSLDKSPSSHLVTVSLDSAAGQDAATQAVSQMRASGLVTHIDVLMPCAGVSPEVQPIESVDLGIMESAFEVNTLGPLALYQACYPLLRESRDAKFMPIGSAAATITNMGKAGSYVAPAYAISKAGLNWIAIAAHCGNDWLTSVALNPGLVATDMGNKTAREVLGLEKAPVAPKQSAERIIAVVDKATRETHSG